MLKIVEFDVNDRRVVLETSGKLKVRIEGYASMPQAHVVTVYNQPNAVTEVYYKLQLGDNEIDLKAGKKYQMVN